MIVHTRTKDIWWNYLGIFFSLGSQIIWIPLLIYYLTPDILGIWYVFVSIGAIVSLFDFGFNPTLGHCVTYVWCGAKELKKDGTVFTTQDSKPNYALLVTVLKACRILYFFIALVTFCIMATVGTFYVQHIAYNYLSFELYCAWDIFIVSIFLNLYIGYYSVIIGGIGDIARKNKAVILSRGVFLGIGIAGLISGMGLIGLSLANLISGFALRYFSKYYLWHFHSFENIIRTYSDDKSYTIGYVISNMWHNAWRDGLVTVTAYLTGQATVLLCSNFLTLAETGIYSFSMQVINTIGGIANGMFVSYVPALQSAYVNKRRDLARILYSRSISAFYMLYCLGVTGFAIVGIPIIKWIRPNFVISVEEFLLLSLSTFLLTRHRNSAWFISTMNTIPYTFSFIFFGIISLIGAYISMQYYHMGLYGLIIAPLIIQSIYNNWHWNKKVNHYLNTTEWRILHLGIRELWSGFCRKL